MQGTCFSSIFSKLRAWASSLERTATCLVMCTREMIPKLDLTLPCQVAHQGEMAHIPMLKLVLTLHSHSTSLLFTLISLHFTSHHLTPYSLYYMHHSIITCASPHALAHSLMGIVNQIVINRRRPLSFQLVGVQATLLYIVVIFLILE